LKNKIKKVHKAIGIIFRVSGSRVEFLKLFFTPTRKVCA
jgi:hypothetical protein